MYCFLSKNICSEVCMYVCMYLSIYLSIHILCHVSWRCSIHWLHFCIVVRLPVVMCSDPNSLRMASKWLDSFWPGNIQLSYWARQAVGDAQSDQSASYSKPWLLYNCPDRFIKTALVANKYVTLFDFKCAWRRCLSVNYAVIVENIQLWAWKWLLFYRTISVR